MGQRSAVGTSLRALLAAAGLALCAVPALAQGLVPDELFTRPIAANAPMKVDADNLVFDGTSRTITANGNVVLRQGGYVITGQSVVYNQASKDAHFVGAVSIRDPRGNMIEASDLKLTGGMKAAFIESLTITTYDGARITADSADYDTAVQTMLVNATYAPCGDCIDAQGRRIGWSVSASKVTYNAKDGSVELEQPSLALLGVPVAWLPYLWIPDTSEAAIENVAMPTLSYGEKIGYKVSVPYTAYSSKWTDLILTPTLLTRQGFLLGAEWVQRFDMGQFRVKASGVYQLDKEAFSKFPDAVRDWRGAIQTSGSFRPVSDWLVGWSYSAFTDAAYLKDYQLLDADSSTNEVYATYLTDESYFDARLQQFNLLGNVKAVTQEQQAKALPNVRFNHIQDLAPGMGRVEISARLLGVQRDSDSRKTINGIPYVYGYAGNKQHGSVQAGWQNQWIGAGGLVLTPYVGGRADFAYYDGSSAIGPDQQSLFTATPIAALDIRYPLIATSGTTTHVIEPIAQLVYRGSDTSLVGITNDDAQSFVFDDTNLFSYDRFSGRDRQETGLRANIGGRYTANFEDGGYLELIAGQSFHIAGTNAFGIIDQGNTGVGAGLENQASYAVLGAYGAFVPGLTVGGKVVYDTSDPHVARAGLDAGFSFDRYTADLEYRYIAANPEAGVPKDQQEAGLAVGVPIDEYWTIKASGYWDIANNSWLEVGTGLVYDDGYLVIGGEVSRTGPTHVSPNDTRISATFRLKAPAGLDVGYSGGL